MGLFDDFNFKALDDPSFKEDAVREEIVAPILKRLGYRPTGDVRVERGKKLLHPFAMIGSKKHPVNIEPDYVLYHGTRALMVIDAKSPWEPIVKSIHVEQAYSYAIHRDVRCRYFALCNGKQLVVYEVDKSEPLLLIDIKNVDARWEEVERFLLPKYLEIPVLRHFKPDLGLHVRRMGIPEGTLLTFPSFHVSLIQMASADDFTAVSTCESEGREHLLSFDLNAAALRSILAPIPGPLREGVEHALSHAPFQADLSCKVIVTCAARLGPLTKGQHEEFRPFNVKRVEESRFDPSVVMTPVPGQPDDRPPGVFHF